MFGFVVEMFKMFKLNKMCVSTLRNIRSKQWFWCFELSQTKMHADLINTAKDFSKGKIAGLVIIYGHTL